MLIKTITLDFVNRNEAKKEKKRKEKERKEKK